MIRSPADVLAPAGAAPSPNSAMRPSAKAIQPRSITRSASTILALPMTVSGWSKSSQCLSSCRGRKRCHVDDPVGDQVAYLVVVDDGDHGNARALLFVDQIHHDGAVDGIERRGRLVEQQDRQVGNKAARDVDALLLAAGKGRRRQRPQPLRNIETAAAGAGLLARLRARRAVRRSRVRPRRRWSATRGTARRNWLT